MLFNTRLRGDGRVARIGDDPPGLVSLGVDGRVLIGALGAVDEDAMHLIVLGVQQDRPAVAAQKINGVRAGDENRWRIHCMFAAGGFDDSQFSRSLNEPKTRSPQPSAKPQAARSK